MATAAERDARMDRLEENLKIVAWLYAELIYHARVAQAEQMLANPDVHEHLIQELISGMK